MVSKKFKKKLKLVAKNSGRDIKSKYLMTLFIDIMGITCAVLVLLISLSIFYMFWIGFGGILPSAQKMVSEIAANPQVAASYAEQLESFGGEFEKFIAGIVLSVIIGVLLMLFCFSTFNFMIFNRIVKKNRWARLLRFYVVNTITFLSWMFVLAVCVLIIRHYLAVLLATIILVMYIWWVNSSCFMFFRGGSVWDSLVKSLKMLSVFEMVSLFVVVISYFVLWIIFGSIFSWSPEAMIFSAFLYNILVWPCGRIVLYNINKVESDGA